MKRWATARVRLRRNGHSAPDMRSLFGHGAFHEEDQRDQAERKDGEKPEVVEVRERRGLLLAQVRKDL